MIRSLRTGVSGLKSNQVKMDVVGDNIANVNTVAFKRSRAAFNEVLGQQLLGVGRTAGGTGINPSFVGLGVAVGSIDKNWGQGALENTGVATDLALSGDGFFIAKAGDRTLLTRAGNFTFNRSGELVTANGLKVQGWKFNEAGDSLLTGAPTDISIDLNAQAPPRYTQNAEIGGNLSRDTAVSTAANDTTQSISTVIYDQQGKPHTMIVDFTKTADNVWNYSIRPESGDAFGNVSVNAGPPVASTVTNPTGRITFGPDGKIALVESSDGAATPTYTALTGTELTIGWNTDNVTQPGGGTTFATMNVDFGGINQYTGSTTATFRDQDGSGSGSLIGYSINPEGILELNFSNGQQQKLFQLAIGNVNNPSGLEQQGENFYITTSASGELQLGRAGRDLKTAVVAGTLEMSNVDLATEFTEMIVSQRGYQAAARVITTSDEMLQETVQIKR